MSVNPLFDLYAARVLPCVNVGIRMRDSSLDLWLSRMMTCFGDVSGRTVLDFGSGSGHKAILLALCTARVTAVEISETEVEFIRAAAVRVNVPLNIVIGGTERLSEFPDEAFDFVLLSEVFEHLPVDQAPEFCDQVARLMRPGGRVFLTTPNRVFYGPAEDSKEYYLRQPYGHHKHYTLAELREYFDRSPFRLRAHYFETHPLTLLRNRAFYPLAVYDYAIQRSLRYPALRFLLRPFSDVVYWLWETLYPVTRRLHHGYENARTGDETTGLTIMLDIERI